MEATLVRDLTSASKAEWTLSATVKRLLPLYARLALAAGFLSSLADRFGLWGKAGSPGVSWGNWSNFVKFTGVLNFFVPRSLVPVFAVAATIAESSLALLLLLGLWKRQVAALSAALLCVFALEMSVALGIKAPLDYSVFAASAAAAILFLWSEEEEKKES